MITLGSKIKKHVLWTELGYQFPLFFYSKTAPVHRDHVLLLIPPLSESSQYFRQKKSPLQLNQWRMLGFDICIFDPLGTGESWGENDWGGKEQQHQIQTILDWLDKKNKKISILCFESALISAVPALKNNALSLIALSPIFREADLQNSYPNLRNKSPYFWKERAVWPFFATLQDRILWFSLPPATWVKRQQWKHRLFRLLQL